MAITLKDKPAETEGFSLADALAPSGRDAEDINTPSADIRRQVDRAVGQMRSFKEQFVIQQLYLNAAQQTGSPLDRKALLASIERGGVTSSADDVAEIEKGALRTLYGAAKKKNTASDVTTELSKFWKN